MRTRGFFHESSGVERDSDSRGRKDHGTASWRARASVDGFVSEQGPPAGSLDGKIGP